MERGPVIVAGIGLRASATLDGLRAGLALIGGMRLSALATAEDKADHPALRMLAGELDLPLIAVPLAALRRQTCATTTPNQPDRYGTGSVAEAAALAACGTGARLVRARQIAPGGFATVALAEGTDP
ncbi:cobalamin biosynthesis protein [uncultured Paracoccus sp.]|uniref:cobalamin biosynthesis protein n=1 Tax=uncultured Paracoccus sp. TaxID=189685 RepID=UPI00261D67E3|nr:cobalamin biosynthesis protein [uncultured Paracoccus sp.]